MKIRNDFVSNSSSCSYVIAIADESIYPLDDLICDIADNCLVGSDDSYSWAKQDVENKAVLNFHWRMTECVYLGMLLAGYHRDTYVKGKDDMFNAVMSDAKTGKITNDGSKAVSVSDIEITVDWSNNVYCPVAFSNRIDSITHVYMWEDKDYAKTDEYKKAADSIAKWANAMSDNEGSYLNKFSSDTYFISRKTIWNTRALIASGYNVKLDPWMDLDKLETILKNGNRILALRVSNGGDGSSYDNVYAYNEWSSEPFEGLTGIDILNSGLS